MNVGEICAIIGAVVAVIPTVISIITLLFNIIKNKNWALVKQIADEVMINVENYSKEHQGMSSDDKLNMALDAIQTGCKAANIKFDENVKNQVKALIEQSINWLNIMQK